MARQCVGCGAGNLDDANFCEECGKVFMSASENLKLDAEQTERSLQQLQTREGELVSQLQSERARLTELNDRLDQIERALNVP